MRKIDVHVAHTQIADEAGKMQDVLHVIARHLKGGPMTLGACAVVLPLDVHVYSDPPRLVYPFSLEPGRECADAIEYRKIAAKAHEYGYKGRVQLDAMFFEAGSWVVLPNAPLRYTAAEHRSGPFMLDIDHWP